MDELTATYDAAFRDAIAADGSIYGEMSPMTTAAHQRRIAILDELDIGDITGKTCLDFGVGSWGFACIYPRLHSCGHAIGMDISEAALAESRRVSAEGDFPYGDNVTYLHSRGHRIPLPDTHVDLVFAGECIEHIEHTRSFLDEIHRVLKDDGVLIVTTPNMDAPIYRDRGERYCVSPEHVALMGYEELLTHLSTGFELLQAVGFNASIHHTLDDDIRDADFCTGWAYGQPDHPQLNTSVVVMARKDVSHTPLAFDHHQIHHASTEIRRTGSWDRMALHGSLIGAGSSETGATLEFDFRGEGVTLNFWMHDWSGIVDVRCDDDTQQRNLYSPQGGFDRVAIEGLDPMVPHRVVITVTGEQDPRSNSHQVIFHQGLAHSRRDT